MTKRKLFILLIIVLTILVLSAILYFISNIKINSTEENTKTNTNFIGGVFDYVDENIIQKPIKNIVNLVKNEDKKDKINKSILNKISSFPISGYGLYKKEIYSYVPDVEIKPTQIKKEESGDDPEANKEVEKTKSTEESSPKKESPKTEFIDVVKYANRENSNIYQNNLKGDEERKFSESIIPYVHESFFTKNSIIMRYLKSNSIITTFLGILPEDKLGSSSIKQNDIFGSFLPNNIKNLSVSKDGSKIFYLSKIKNGVVGILTNSRGDNKTQIFDSSFSEWTSFWPNSNTITLSTKPSGLVEGYSYTLNTDSKEFNKLLGGILGLTTKMNSGENKILYSDKNMSLYVLNRNTNEPRSLNIKTLPEKCIWSSDGINIYCAIPDNYSISYLYPDSWYMGEVSFNDNIYKINTTWGTKTKIISLYSLAKESIDAINLQLNEKENYLFFMNKLDNNLWSLKLN